MVTVILKKKGTAWATENENAFIKTQEMHREGYL